MEKVEIKSKPKKKISKLKIKESNEIYIKSLFSRDICISITNIGINMKETLERIIANDIEGKCIIQGYVKPGSIKVQNYSSGLILSDKIVFTVIIECYICNPVEGMIINCFAQNITKAGIRAMISNDNSPLLIFIARDHNYMSSYFNSIKENDNIKIKVIGQRYELNDKYISVIANLVEEDKSILQLQNKVKKQPKLILKDEKDEKDEKE
jgi:DNA-directed RNA polymerase subunit E'/Rpb7